MIEEILVEACGSCKAYKESKLNLYESRTGASPRKLSEKSLKKYVSGFVDVSFPVYGASSRPMMVPESMFQLVVKSPGCAIIGKKDETGPTVIINIISSMLGVWPLFLVTSLLMTIFGMLIWFLVGVYS